MSSEFQVPLDLVRQDIAQGADKVVVKIGTRVLTAADGTLDPRCVARVSEQVARWTHAGRKVVIVSSGAVGAGIGRLQLKERPRNLPALQATASVGQSVLIEAYNQSLVQHGLHAAQVLLTAEDLNDRSRYLNVRNTLHSLFDMQAVPIVNENDAVSVDELQLGFGDNDRLAALVTNLLQAPLLLLLSDVQGLFDRPPSQQGASVIATVLNTRQEIERVHRELSSAQSSTGQPLRLSTGGMGSKLAAAELVAKAGGNVIIADGGDPEVVNKALSGETVGSLIVAQGARVKARKRWIGLAVRPKGNVHVDTGAAKAVRESGRSLLPVGIERISGDFAKGDVVAIIAPDGTELARGLSNYPSIELKRIAGVSTDQIGAILGHRPYTEAIHRDNLVLSK